MNDAVRSWLLFPVYVWQGIGIRGRIERMLPPAGPAHGAFGPAAPGHEPTPADTEIRLLVLGDSSAAGVGVDRMEDSLACRLAERLHVLTGRPVRWRAIGSNSAVSSDLRDVIVPNLAREPYTHILLTTGTNDVKNFHTARRFKRGFGGLLYALRARWPDARIVWSPPVDMLRVPALPLGLARVLDLRAKILDASAPASAASAASSPPRPSPCRTRRLLPRRLPRLRPRRRLRGGALGAVCAGGSGGSRRPRRISRVRPDADYAAGRLRAHVLKIEWRRMDERRIWSGCDGRFSARTRLKLS